ncbi:MAG: tetratricopeptide repeat protein [Candidatus Aminicenantes bacterium]|nr:tetratricopeptide repeat protein [Candidatus Aminicenantes bacterium]
MNPILEIATRDMAANDLVKAEIELNRCLALVPDEPEVFFHLSQIHYLRGKYGESLAMIEKAIKNYPDFIKLLASGKQERFDRLERKKEALFEEILSMESAAQVVVCQRENINREIDIIKKQIQSLSDEQMRIGLEEPRIPAEYHFLCGNCFFKIHRYQDAELQYLESIKANGRYADAYNNLINLYYMEKDYQKADKTIDQAEKESVSVNPKLRQAVQTAKKTGASTNPGL